MRTFKFSHGLVRFEYQDATVAEQRTRETKSALRKDCATPIRFYPCVREAKRASPGETSRIDS